MPILNVPVIDTDDEPVTAAQAADIVHSAVHAAVSAGVAAALGAMQRESVEIDTGFTWPEQEESDGLTTDETALLEAYRLADEMHRLTALRTLERGAPAKDND